MGNFCPWCGTRREAGRSRCVECDVSFPDVVAGPSHLGWIGRGLAIGIATVLVLEIGSRLTAPPAPQPSAASRPAIAASTPPTPRRPRVAVRPQPPPLVGTPPVRPASPTATPVVRPTPRPLATRPAPLPRAPNVQVTASVDLDAMDRRALSAPHEAARSVETLAAWLVADARNDTERARAIFRWITANIHYDVAAFRARRHLDTAPAVTLAARSAVCGGYARLFEALARAANLEVETISGFSRGVGYEVGDEDTKSNHAWNAVRIGGVWKLLDCTWGSGHLDASGVSVQEFDPYFFFTPPEQLIYSHFPDEARWQLLARPLTREAHQHLACLTSHGLAMGLRPVSHDGPIIDANDAVAVTVAVPPNVTVSAQLASRGAAAEATTFTQEENGRQVVRVAFPGAGTYELRIFAGERGQRRLHEGLMYRVRARAGNRYTAAFPRRFGTFAACGARLVGPFEGHLRAGLTQPFTIAVPGAKHVMVVVGEQWTELQPGGDTFSGSVPLAAGPVRVMARFDEPAPGERSGRYEGLLEYVAE